MTDLVRVPCISPDKIYKYRRKQPLSGAEVVTYMSREVKEIEGEGIFTYYHGVDIPRIGVSPTYQDFPKAMAEVDKVKRVLREYLKNPLIIFRPEKTLESFNGFADKCLGQWYLSSDYWCPTTRAIWIFVSGFLDELGIGNRVSERIADKTAEIIATLFEYDDAYRYRLNDLMSETTKQAMIANFPKEIGRLMEIYRHRENIGGMYEKLRNIHRLLRVLCLIPRVKRAIIQGLESVDWQGWQLTESEIFHTLLWDDYDVQGKKDYERQAYYEAIFRGKQKPQQIKIKLA